MSIATIESDSVTVHAVKPHLTRVVTILLLVYPLFGQIVPTVIGLGAFGLGSLLLTLWFVEARAWSGPGAGLTGLTWFMLGFYALASHLVSNLATDMVVVAFIISTALVTLASTAKNWGNITINILVGMLFLHAVATVVFYFFPSVFEATIRPRFFHEATFSIDYRSSLTSNSGYNAMFAGLGLICIAVSLTVERLSKKGRLLRWLVAAVFLFALLLTSKRAHLLFAILSVLLVYVSSTRSAKWTKLAFGGTVGVVLLFWIASTSQGVTNTLDRFLETFDAATLDDATSGRTFLWHEAILGWQSSPVYGNGWASFYVAWPNGRTESLIAHNQVLNLLYEGGVVGLILFIPAAFTSLFVAYRRMRLLIRAGSMSDRVVVPTVSFAIQLFFLVYSCTGGELLSKPYTFIPYFLAVALGFSAQNETRLLADTHQRVGKRSGENASNWNNSTKPSL